MIVKEKTKSFAKKRAIKHDKEWKVEVPKTYKTDLGFAERRKNCSIKKEKNRVFLNKVFGKGFHFWWDCVCVCVKVEIH